MNNPIVSFWVNLSLITFRVGLVCMAILALAGGDLRASDYQVVKGTRLEVIFVDEISSGNHTKGQKINFELVKPVQFGGTILLMDSGTVGVAEVVEVEKASRPGKPGSISVKFLSIKPQGSYVLDESVADGIIQLKSDPFVSDSLTAPITAEGKGRKLLSYLFIMGLFIKGGDAVIIPGEVYTVEVAAEVMFHSKEN